MKGASLLFLLLIFNAQCEPCPKGYTQAPNAGACYEIKLYYDSFIGQYVKQKFDVVDRECESSGAFLASIHSKEEIDYVYSLMNFDHCSSNNGLNIGLKCKGKSCSWYDGSPVTYTNFDTDPRDGTATKCYCMDSFGNHSWRETDCEQDYDPAPHDCWLCKKPIECVDYETAYNGGCVSVYSWPLNQKNAEEDCPNGGHLVSIHSDDENSHYKQLALAAGLNGTVYIGGQFTKGQFLWIDGTNYDDSNHWAKGKFMIFDFDIKPSTHVNTSGFPNEVLGSCVQMMLDSNFGVQGLWSNVDCTVKQPYMCFRPGFVPASPQTPTLKADERCPPIQYFTESGFVYSPNYPVSIPSQQTCEYVLTATEGSKAKLIFHKFDCRSGTSLALYDGDDDLPFIIFSSNSPSPMQVYTASSNVLKIVFSSDGTGNAIGTGWEAEFTGN